MTLLDYLAIFVVMLIWFALYLAKRVVDSSEIKAHIFMLFWRLIYQQDNAQPFKKCLRTYLGRFA